MCDQLCPNFSGVFIRSFLLLSFCSTFLCWCWRTGSENNRLTTPSIHLAASFELIVGGFTVPHSLYLSLWVPAGDFSRQLTFMWRRAALHGWWPMRISQSSLYQVSYVFYTVPEIKFISFNEPACTLSHIRLKRDLHEACLVWFVCEVVALKKYCIVLVNVQKKKVGQQASWSLLKVI